MYRKGRGARIATDSDTQLVMSAREKRRWEPPDGLRVLEPAWPKYPALDSRVHIVRPAQPYVTGFYGNARSFRQASGEFCQQILDCDAHVWCITESHLKDDAVATMIPRARGYSIVCRNDRSKHGGGILMGANTVSQFTSKSPQQITRLIC